jgi:Arc/MetJ family transcription regulator
MHMRTTLNIDQELLEKASRYTGIKEKTALVRAGLQALVEREAARRLVDLGGSMPGIREPKRRKTAS